MSPRRLLVRSLRYHRGIHFAVALGVAVGAATLTGALVVGDSVRASLRNLTLDRLGRIDHALVADRYFREALAAALGPEATPAVFVRGSVEAADSGARAARVRLHGVDGRFWALYPGFSEPPELGPRDAAINRSLARELGVEEGAAILVRFQADTLVPAESVMGRKSENVRTLRLTVKRVLDDAGPGRFGLASGQQLPLNLFLSLAALQRALERPGRVNALLVADDPAPQRAAEWDRRLAERAALDDYELELRALPDGRALSLQTGRVVLEQATAEAAREAAAAAGLEPVEVLTYLANTIRAGEREIPYSTVTALSDSGGALPAFGPGEILLNEWAARELAARPGDRVELEYYVVGAGGALETERRAFTLAGVVRLEGLAADRDLAPPMKGMSDVQRMGDWDPPFPVDLGRIRPADEDYWERHRTAPKAFVHIDAAKRLWTSRFGQLTSIRLSAPSDRSPDEARTAFEQEFRKRLKPEALGLGFLPVKARGLEASEGATDFSGLFIGFSLFLIAAAAALTALLFRLGVERRAAEIGLLTATGWSPSQIRRLLLGEGALVSALGVLIGLPGAAAYAALMVHGLTTWWSAAVGGAFLTLHVRPASLAAGGVAAFLLMFVAIRLSVRRLERLSPRALLAGRTAEERGLAGGQVARRPYRGAIAAFAAAAAALAASSQAAAAAQAAGFFAGGALLLVAALAWFQEWLRRPLRRALSFGAASLWRLGVRNGARAPTRSVLSAALVAGASFTIVAVALMRHDASAAEPNRGSGDGGYRFIAESDVPLFPEQLRGVEGLAAWRAKPGEDASCLNLYRPSRPTLLGAPRASIERGGFAFAQTLAETEAERANPWLLLEKEFPDGAIPVFGDANSVQWILHLGLGRTLEVEDSRGRLRKLVIAGLLSRSVFQSELILAESRFLELFPDRGGYQVFLLETDDREAGLELEERFAEFGFDAQTTADRLAGYLVVENTYLSTFLTLGGLGLLLGTLGLAVVMARNAIERRGELALLQAVGFGRPAVSRLVLAENAFVLLFGVGIGAATAVLASLPHLLSGLAEPPWASLALTLATILAVGLTAGAAAVAVSLRQPLLESLRHE